MYKIFALCFASYLFLYFFSEEANSMSKEKPYSVFYNMMVSNPAEFLSEDGIYLGVSGKYRGGLDDSGKKGIRSFKNGEQEYDVIDRDLSLTPQFPKLFDDLEEKEVTNTYVCVVSEMGRCTFKSEEKVTPGTECYCEHHGGAQYVGKTE